MGKNGALILGCVVGGIVGFGALVWLLCFIIVAIESSKEGGELSTKVADP